MRILFIFFSFDNIINAQLNSYYQIRIVRNRTNEKSPRQSQSNDHNSSNYDSANEESQKAGENTPAAKNLRSKHQQSLTNARLSNEHENVDAKSQTKINSTYSTQMQAQTDQAYFSPNSFATLNANTPNSGYSIQNILNFAAHQYASTLATGTTSVSNGIRRKYYGQEEANENGSKADLNAANNSQTASKFSM